MTKLRIPFFFFSFPLNIPTPDFHGADGDRLTFERLRIACADFRRCGTVPAVREDETLIHNLTPTPTSDD